VLLVIEKIFDNNSMNGGRQEHLAAALRCRETGEIDIKIGRSDNFCQHHGRNLVDEEGARPAKQQKLPLIFTVRRTISDRIFYSIVAPLSF
jgi:hypothetical protein